MRAGPSDRVAASSIGRGVRVSSWLGATLLAGSVPVDAGRLTEDGGQEIPDELRLTVPARANGRSWDPTGDPTHPLGRYGQRLNVIVDVRNPNGRTWEIPIGWFQVQSWGLSGDESSVDVVAKGLLQVPADDDFVAPVQPRAGGTFASEFRRLMSAGIPVSISASLVDRACPGGFVWETDRLAALYDLADAWPARITTTPEGIVEVGPPLGVSPVPVLTLTHGGGVVISAPRNDTRAGVYTAVVAKSSADTSTSAPVSAEYVTTAGSYATSTYGVVRTQIASPLLGTVAACAAAAQTHAENSQRQGQLIDITLPPDPRIQRGDPVALVRPEATYVGWVIKTSLPLTVDGSPMSLTVGVPG